MVIAIAGGLAVVGFAFLFGGYKLGYTLLSYVGDGCMLVSFVALVAHVCKLI